MLRCSLSQFRRWAALKFWFSIYDGAATRTRDVTEELEKLLEKRFGLL